MIKLFDNNIYFNPSVTPHPRFIHHIYISTQDDTLTDDAVLHNKR